MCKYRELPVGIFLHMIFLVKDEEMSQYIQGRQEQVARDQPSGGLCSDAIDGKKLSICCPPVLCDDESIGTNIMCDNVVENASLLAYQETGSAGAALTDWSFQQYLEYDDSHDDQSKVVESADIVSSSSGQTILAWQIALGLLLSIMFYDTQMHVIIGLVLLVLSTSFVPLLVMSLQRLMSVLHLRVLLRQQKRSNNKGSVVGYVSNIFIYPVKSMRAVSLQESHLDTKGMVDDRRLMVVYELPLPVYKTKWNENDLRYRFLTQRQCPPLATITATLGNSYILTLEVVIDNLLRRIEIPLNSSVSISQGSFFEKRPRPFPTLFLAGIWEDTILVQDMGDEAANFLQSIVDADEQSTFEPGQCKVRLLRHSINDRSADPKFTPSYAKTWWGSTPLVSLTDGFPILIASEASLENVNQELKKARKQPIHMNRFRPNIVLKGDSLKAFDEDKWKVIAIGNVMFAIVKACPRCKQSCTNQITGKVTEEPVTMKSFRALGNKESGDDVFFAQNVSPFLDQDQDNHQSK